MEPTTADRIEELEKLISSLRHDARSIICSVALIADQMREHRDPTVQRSGTRISDVVARLLARLDATYNVVSPRGGRGPVIGPGGQIR
jgi:hypothetical protein